MIVSTPLALVLLVAIPPIIYVGYPRYRYRRVRDSISLFLRVVIVLLLVLALAGLQAVQAADRLAVVFLVDASDSIGATVRQQELDYVQQSIHSMRPDDEAGMILFGANALIERPLSNVRELEEVRSTPDTGNTNLEAAIWLGLSMFPSDAARRLVILSDGHPTIGNAESAAQRAAAEGIEISYVPFFRPPTPEVQVTDLRVPSEVSEGQQFDLNLTISSQAATPATVTILASGTIINQENVDLKEGTNSYVLSLKSNGSGFKDFQVRVDPKGSDGFYQNNQLATFSRVIGPPRVLLVSTSDQESQYLAKALQQNGLIVDQTAPTGLPIGVAALAQYQSVILVDVPAEALLNHRMESIESYVKDLGGGLVVVGGPDSYAPGGYFQTPLEDALPVEMQIKDQQRLPQLTIAYVIDRSGSMGAPAPSGVAAIDLAKEAMIRSINFLQPTDRAAVLSFDTEGSIIAPFQQVLDRQSLQRLIATLRPSGGTDILAGMRLTAQEIADEPSPRKHIILLTDGGASPIGLVELTQELYDKQGVTTSVISIGPDAPDFLKEMATVGHGNYHQVIDIDAIPAIFTSETVLASRSYITEQQFVPTLTANNPIMQGITAAPPLLGYVATTPKAASQVILRGPEPFHDPILVSWQYGLGRSVAFTSDATARWGTNWVQWSDFSRFWSQAVRWTISAQSSDNLESRVVMENGQARVIVDARDQDGAFLNGLKLNLSLIDPNLSGQSVTLQQVAPGRYEGVFKPSTEGAYFMRLSGSAPDAAQVNQTTGWVMSYSPEYAVTANSDGAAVLDQLAKLTNGRSLADDPGGAFAHTLQAKAATSPLWQSLLLFALLLLPLDIAVRRLIVTRSDLVHVAQRVRSVFSGRQFAPAAATSERIGSLMDARERARQRTEQQASGISTATALRMRRERPRNERDEQPAAPAPQAPAASKPRYTPPLQPAAEPKDPNENVAERLLKKRRKEQGGDE